MKNLPAVVVHQKNKISTSSAWIVLLDISITTTFYLCSNNESVSFGGHTYEPFPFDLEPHEENNKGEIPTLSLKVANVTQLIQEQIEENDGGVGSSITIRVVNSDYLTSDYSELEMEFSILAAEASAEWLTLTLGAPNPLRRRFPPWRYISSHCHWDFKSVECGYSGGATVCDRTWERCQALNNTVRFGGYRGLTQKGWRVV
jgi:phage-related protein